MSDELLSFRFAQWIWYSPNAEKDTYSDFMSEFEWNGIGNVILKLSSDSNYVVYVNGQLVSFGQYADYPSYKVGDEIDITSFIHKGKNLFASIVWYYGVDSSTYLTGEAGLIYEISCDEEVLDYSREQTLSREDPGYRQRACELITVQMGLSFYRDEENSDDGFLLGKGKGFKHSYLIPGASKIYKRPISRLLLKERCPSEIIMNGNFIYPSSSLSVAEKMQQAIFESDSTTSNACSESGKYYIFDLGIETVGFIDLELELSEPCQIDIGWGEHLADGRCRTAVRNFTVGFNAKAGKNRYMNPFRRFGARYLQLFIHSNQAVITYAGIRPSEYPLTIKKYCSPNSLRNTIYETCVRTLISCMHEHYEDCPWREQSLYTMDSRNQMLCGYYAFNEFKFPRASLRLIGEGLQDYGLLSICYPANGDLSIPSFSCMYFIQMEEYIRFSGDKSLAQEMYPRLEILMQTFIDRIDNTGLIPEFRDDEKYWNFYEWNETLDGEDKNPGSIKYHVVLNADVSLALKSFAEICRNLGKDTRAAELESIANNLNLSIKNYFFDTSRSLFITMKGEQRISVLANAVCILCGAIGDENPSNILSLLSTNGLDKEGNEAAIPCTLSMNCFRYDAMLMFDRKHNAPIIIEDIDKNYLFMLEQGATTFWETLKGLDGFDGASSLCHGWSALPIYYYETLL